MIRDAKARGVRVTAETAPHYLTLTDACLEGYDTNVRVNPPIAEESDREALLAGVADGTIDVIATDHAPHSRREKETEFAVAAPGICGLETLFALSHTALVESGRMSLLQLLSALSLRPAGILKINKGTLDPGADADMVVLDPAAERIIDATRFQSQSDNSPFHGRKVRGAVVATFVGGKLIYLNRAYQERWSGPTEGIPVCV
jgi:dihydroorotase